MKILKSSSEPQPENIIIEQYCNCLFVGGNQSECDNNIIKSVNHDINLQKVRKTNLSVFDEKRF